MATTDEDELYPDAVEAFEDDWYRFRGLLPAAEREHWDVLVERAKNRPYPGHCQMMAVDDAKWPIVFTMLVTQQAELSRLREQLHELEPKRETLD